MTQTKVSTGYVRSIKRKATTKSRAPSAAPSPATAPVPSAPSSVVWQWLDSPGWTAYDAQANAILEQAKASGQTVVALNHGFFGTQGGYTINLTTMIQTRTSTGFTRKVQRIDLASTNTPAVAPQPVPTITANPLVPLPAPTLAGTIELPFLPPKVLNTYFFVTAAAAPSAPVATSPSAGPVWSIDDGKGSSKWSHL